jgi:hypothetical protein
LSLISRSNGPKSGESQASGRGQLCAKGSMIQLAQMGTDNINMVPVMIDRTNRR